MQYDLIMTDTQIIDQKMFAERAGLEDSRIVAKRIDQKMFAERAGLEDSRIVASRIIEAFAFPTEEEQDRMDARAAERASKEREAEANAAFYAGEGDDVQF